MIQGYITINQHPSGQGRKRRTQGGELPNNLVHGNRRRTGQVEAASGRVHRHPDHLPRPCGQQRRGEPLRFTAEHDRVTRSITDVEIALPGGLGRRSSKASQ